MKKGDIVEVSIESYAFEGKGVAKVQLEGTPDDKKFTVFVEGAYPGDTVKAFIRKKKKNYAEAKIEEILVKSPERIDARCNFFQNCGGCKQQDLDYKIQTKYKQAQVTETFEHIGGLTDFENEEIIAGKNQFFYRNKMEYSFSDKRWIPKEELNSEEEITDRNFALGLHIPRIFDKVLDIDECFLMSELSNKILNATRDFFKSRGVSVYNTRNHVGYLRNLVIKESHFTHDLMVNLVTHEDNPELMKEYTEHLLSEVPQITTVINNVNTRKAQVALGDYEKVYHGDGYIYDQIGEYKYRISANSFFQTNTLQAQPLYQTALDYADIKKEDIVYDLYSGAGTISLYISKFAKKVYAIESVEPAVEDAKMNSKFNNVDNVEFILGDLNKSFLPVIKEQNIPNPDIVIADPPRSGMNPKTVKDLLKIAPKRIVYVSCNPASQVRDITMLIEGGYKLKKIRPVDMFPQTYHIENVALLEK